jgi:hypothetical protein
VHYRGLTNEWTCVTLRTRCVGVYYSTLDIEVNNYLRTIMLTPFELYDLLDKADVEYEVIEMFEGVRYLRVLVTELETEEGLR